MRLIFLLALAISVTAFPKYDSDKREPLRSEFATDVEVRPGYDAFRRSAAKSGTGVFVSQFGGASKKDNAALYDRFRGHLFNDKPYHDEKIIVDESIPNLLSGDLTNLPVPDSHKIPRTDAHAFILSSVVEPSVAPELLIPNRSHLATLLGETIVDYTTLSMQLPAPVYLRDEPTQSVAHTIDNYTIINHPMPQIVPPADYNASVPDYSQNIRLLGETVTGDTLASGSSYDAPAQHAVMPMTIFNNYGAEPSTSGKLKYNLELNSVVKPEMTFPLSMIDHSENVPVISETIIANTANIVSDATYLSQLSQKTAVPISIYDKPVATPDHLIPLTALRESHDFGPTLSPSPQLSANSFKNQLMLTEIPHTMLLVPSPVINISDSTSSESDSAQPIVTNQMPPQLPVQDYSHRIPILGYLSTFMPGVNPNIELSHTNQYFHTPVKLINMMEHSTNFHLKDLHHADINHELRGLSSGQVQSIEEMGYVEPPKAHQNEPSSIDESHLSVFTYHLATPIPRDDTTSLNNKLELEFIPSEYAAPRGHTLSSMTPKDEQESNSYYIATARPRYNTPPSKEDASVPSHAEANEYHLDQPVSLATAMPLTPEPTPMPSSSQFGSVPKASIDGTYSHVAKINDHQTLSLSNGYPNAQQDSASQQEQPTSKQESHLQHVQTHRHDEEDTQEKDADVSVLWAVQNVAGTLKPLRPKSTPADWTTTLMQSIMKELPVNDHDDVDAAIANVLRSNNLRCKEGALSSLGKCRRQYYKCVRGERQPQLCTQQQFVFSEKDNDCVPKALSMECDASMTPRIVKVTPTTTRHTIQRTTPSKSGIIRITQMPNVMCTAHADGFYRHSTNCSRIIQCFGGEKFEYPPCPNNLAFDESTGSCNYRENVDACADSLPPTKPSPTSIPASDTATSGSNECSHEMHGSHMRNPNNCSSFYRCVWRRRVLMNCPIGTVFNPRLDVCDYPHNVPECKTP